MKIERKKVEPKFEPITITIQSQAELDALLVGLNHSEESFKDALVDIKITPDAFQAASEVVAGIWFKINSLYKAEQ